MKGTRFARDYITPPQLTVEQDMRRQLVNRRLPRTIKHCGKSWGGAMIVSDDWNNGIPRRPRPLRGGRKPSLGDYDGNDQ